MNESEPTAPDDQNAVALQIDRDASDSHSSTNHIPERSPSLRLPNDLSGGSVHASQGVWIASVIVNRDVAILGAEERAASVTKGQFAIVNDVLKQFARKIERVVPR